MVKNTQKHSVMRTIKLTVELKKPYIKAFFVWIVPVLFRSVISIQSGIIRVTVTDRLQEIKYIMVPYE